MGSETLSIIYGLGSAITWGAGDFSGGFATRRGSVLTVLLFSQLLGMLLLIGIAILFGECVPATAAIVWGSSAGIFGSLGLIALYQGLASGRMGIIASISAVTTAIIPIVVAFFSEGAPRASQGAGFAMAMAAVWFLSSGETGAKIEKKELSLSVLAGLGFGLFFICMDRGSETTILWPLLSARAASLLLISLIVSIRRKIERPARGQLLYIVLAGVLDVSGNTFFALASQVGRLDVSAILASLYPASTVMLAWIFLKERLNRRQWIGVAAAMGSLVFIAS